MAAVTDEWTEVVWKAEGTNITEKGSSKSNKKGKSNCIIWWRKCYYWWRKLHCIERGMEKTEKDLEWRTRKEWTTKFAREGASKWNDKAI